MTKDLSHYTQYDARVRERLDPLFNQLIDSMKNGDQKRHNILRRIRTACRQEIDYLLANNTPAHARALITDYRKELKRRDPDHIALRYFKLGRVAKEAVQKLEADYGNKIIENIGSLKLVEDPDSLIKAGRLLLLSDSYVALAAGLMLLTGRRPTEILKTAEFKVETRNTLLFRGQLKRKEGEPDPKWFSIPVLADANIVCTALRVLREKRNFSHLTIRQVTKLCTKEFKKVCKERLPPAENPKDLRAIYALLSHHL